MSRVSLIDGFALSCLAVVIPTNVLAQERIMGRAAVESRTVQFTMDDLKWVEPAADSAEASVTIIGSTTQSDVQTRTVPVTRTRIETRTRTIQQDGKPVVQNYTVTIPYTEMVQQAYTANASGDDTSQTTIPLTRVIGFDRSGKQLDPNRLENQLATPTAAFVLKTPWRNGGELDPKWQSVLRDDTLFLFVRPESPSASGGK